MPTIDQDTKKDRTPELRRDDKLPIEGTMDDLAQTLTRLNKTMKRIRKLKGGWWGRWGEPIFSAFGSSLLAALLVLSVWNMMSILELDKSVHLMKDSVKEIAKKDIPGIRTDIEDLGKDIREQRKSLSKTIYEQRKDLREELRSSIKELREEMASLWKLIIIKRLPKPR